MTFEEWLSTDTGKNCSDFNTLTNEKYLLNRLKWAFDAGQIDVARLQATIDWYEKQLRELKQKSA